MDHKQGEVKKEINGKPYTFKYGMASSLILSKKVDITQLSKNPIEFIAYLFWAGLMTRQAENGLKDNFSDLDAALLIDDMTETDASEVYEVAIESLGFVTRLSELQEEKKARATGNRLKKHPA